MKALLRPIREKLDLLEIVELKDNRDHAERLVLLDLPDLLEHRFVIITTSYSLSDIFTLKWVFVD